LLIYIICKGLFFCGGIDFPVVAVGAQGCLCVCVLEGDIVSVLAVSAEFEQVGDPGVAVVFFQAGEQVDGQL